MEPMASQTKAQKSIETRVIQAAQRALAGLQCVSAIDVLTGIGFLTKKQVGDWRFGGIPYLERAAGSGLGKISRAMKVFRSWAAREGLKSRETAYRNWGQGPKRELRFSKSGDPAIERAYRTHFVPPCLGGGNRMTAGEAVLSPTRIPPQEKESTMDGNCPDCRRNGSCPEHPGDKGLYADGRLNMDHGHGRPAKIRVYVDEGAISMAMEDQSNGIDRFFYLDKHTGGVVFLPGEVLSAVEDGDEDGDGAAEWDPAEEEWARKVLQGHDRFVSIPRMDSRESFTHMGRFAQTVKEPKASKHLWDALGRNHPFRGFKDALRDYPGLLEKWREFKDGKMREAAREFVSGLEDDRIGLALPEAARD